MKLSALDLPEPIAIRFVADFDVQIQPKELVRLGTRQRKLLHDIVSSPATLRLIARMSVETDLAGITGRHLSGLLDGPDTQEILQCILPCLSQPDRSYWEGLREGPGDTLHVAIMPVFLAFNATLRVARVDVRSSDIELDGKAVGPIIDAGDLPKR